MGYWPVGRTCCGTKIAIKRLTYGVYSHCENNMPYLARAEEMQDADFCRRKEIEYSAKARATNDRAVKSAYKAAAREYAYRAALINSKKAM